jgi:D-amino-acid dehydrogenase
MDCRDEPGNDKGGESIVARTGLPGRRAVNVIVLGGGVVGIATAYYLAEDGHDVTVIDRQQEAASETSLGNAGLVSPGDSYAWASPEALRMFVKSLYRRDLGISVRPSLDPHFLAWTGKFLLQCTHARARVNTLRKLRIALYARDCINALEARTGIDYHSAKHGILYFYRSQASLDHGAAHMRLLAENGLKIEVVDRNRLAEIEPALETARDSLAGGIYSPMDQTGDSAEFSRRLADWLAANRNVRFSWLTTVTGIEIENGKVSCILTDKGSFCADAYVLAMGADSALIARPIGIRLPIYPVKGYSITVPIREPGLAPRLGGVDEDKLIAYSRLGDRLRIASTAEFAGYDRSHEPRNFRAVMALAKELFGAALDLAQVEYWAGLRPMTPTSVPILGPARYGNFHLNVGHGHVGWTMAAGTGKFVADLIAGRKPEIDPEGLTYEG